MLAKTHSLAGRPYTYTPFPYKCIGVYFSVSDLQADPEAICHGWEEGVEAGSCQLSAVSCCCQAARQSSWCEAICALIHFPRGYHSGVEGEWKVGTLPAGQTCETWKSAVTLPAVLSGTLRRLATAHEIAPSCVCCAPEGSMLCTRNATPKKLSEVSASCAHWKRKGPFSTVWRKLCHPHFQWKPKEPFSTDSWKEGRLASSCGEVVTIPLSEAPCES
jgi:hypothetical protein